MKKGTVDVSPDVFGTTFKGRARISAVVTRANGTVEDLGVIAESDNRSFLARVKSKLCSLLSLRSR